MLIACLATIYLVWGSSYLVTKIGVSRLPPFLFGGVRFMLGGTLLFTLAVSLARRHNRATPRPTTLDLRHLIIVGSCAVFISNGGNIWGVQYVPSNLAALLNVSAAFWIPILGMFGARAHRIDARVALGLLTGFAGTVFVAAPGAEASMHAAYGVGVWPVIAILAGCIGWSAGTIYQRNVDTSLDLLAFTALQMFFGGILLLAVGIALGETSRWSWDPLALTALLYMTVFSSCIGYSAYAWLTVNATPAQVGTYGFVNPVIAILLGDWVLDESLTRLQLVGSAVILVAMLLIHWRGSAQPTVRSADSRDPPP